MSESDPRTKRYLDGLQELVRRNSADLPILPRLLQELDEAWAAMTDEEQDALESRLREEARARLDRHTRR